MAYNQQQPMPTSDELAALFRNMTFQQPQPQQEPSPEPEEPVITYSISQHYHHSAHIARQEDDAAVPTPPRPSSEPTQSQQPSAEQILRDHGVDPSALSAAQLQLFKTADDGQKQRLIELWRICPPSPHPAASAMLLALSSTTLEQEELLAQLRYEQRLEAEEREGQLQQQQGGNADITMSLDDTPLTPIQTAEGRWVVAMSPPYGEPYMLSGYEELARRDYEESARRQYEEEAAHPPKDVYSHFGAAVGGYRPATDPVYSGNAWALRRQQQQQQQQQQQEAMENQYGAFQQMGGMEF
ncbi:hypothetical protein F4775DRAFT_459661 [Biscogniauxia sp. FL1348]|nr:hypothetical protein F4775DRAFT_459661 [Biscogniauxia sp. FL1348]